MKPMRFVYAFVAIALFIIVVTQVGCNLGSGSVGLAGTGTVNAGGNTIAQRYVLGNGFERMPCEENSFAHYLRNLKLKPAGAVVHYYNGETKDKDNVYDAVVDMEIGNRNLQQCADAVMRLRAEYLFAQKRYSDIHFNFTNGFKAEYSKWREGYRISVSGNKVSWVKSAKPSATYADFRKFMDMVFTYAGTMSLQAELKPRKLHDMRSGDVLIQGGSPGHAVLVVDRARDTRTGQVYFMLVQSYMPAQEIQVLVNPADETTVWYKLDTSKRTIATPEWKFTSSDLRSF